MNTARRCLAAVVGLLFLPAALNVPALAQSTLAPNTYRVGPGDRLYLQVDQRPDLSRELVVDDNGAVSLPLIGKVDVGGLTVPEIQQRLLQSLKDYYPSINAISVVLREGLSQVVYITGQVVSPGKYSFHLTPNLWDAIREAGGPAPTAALDAVRIVKDPSKGGGSTVVNVQNALERGSVDDLPDLEAGDTVIIPAAQQNYTGSSGVNVIGAVLKPGVYKLGSQQDLVSAILAAGGPSDRASLDRVQIIRPAADGTVQTIAVDLSSYLGEGNPVGNPQLRPGDTINVPKQGRLSQLANADVGILLNLLTTAVTVTALIVTINRKK